ncbi:hypothetical protein H6G00_01395 [Leptolyngbya sp. FACHB-541]|uniref:hypothetical protein n=1 Tax=Leptolyngbya sp. FACHB-541 TaxID=2692810 RepID=UPI001684A86B|nr:hypothetical protein [Leptolyngbya sp. FACHB-541]MBD1995284.1 hypothetical protein [Leptolyngbya sp. FACHB-541]
MPPESEEIRLITVRLPPLVKAQLQALGDKNDRPFTLHAAKIIKDTIEAAIASGEIKPEDWEKYLE